MDKTLTSVSKSGQVQSSEGTSREKATSTGISYQRMIILLHAKDALTGASIQRFEPRLSMCTGSIASGSSNPNTLE